MNTKLLRQKILDLAIRGKLTEQKKSDGTTKDLLAQISKQWLVSSKQDSQKENASSNVIASTTSTSSRTPIRDPFAASKNSDDVIASTAKQSKKKTFAPKQIIPLDKSEAPFEIPENWEWVRLGDVCKVFGRIGFRGYTKKDLVEKGEGAISLSPSNMDNMKLRFDKCTFISWEKYEESPEIMLDVGDVVVVKTGSSYGKTVLVEYLPEKTTLNPQLMVLKQILCNNKYLCYYLNTAFFRKIFEDLVNGTAIPTFSQEKFSLKFFPLPPLAEQQRIVTAIENAFAEITAIENNQELLKKHIKQGRQKILDLAIRGRLTQQLKTDGTTKDLLAQISKQWLVSSKQDSQKENAFSNVIANTTSTSSRTPIRDPFAASKNSDDVIASTAKQSKKKTFAPKEIIPLDKSEAPFEIPENWEWVRLGDLSEKIQYGYNAPAKDTGRIKMVRITDIHDNAVEWDSVPFCDIEESEIPTYLLKKNDILFARTGGTVGKSFIVNEVPEDAVYAGYLIRTRYGKNINAQYMKYFMESNLYWVQLREGCIATAQPNCNGQTLGKMQIPLPPLAEQQRIVAAIESAFTEFDAMEKGIL